MSFRRGPPLREFQGPGHGGPRRTACEDAFLDGETARRRDALGVADRDYLVDDALVVRPRDEVLADSLDEVGVQPRSLSRA